MKIIDVEHLTKKFKDTKVLKGVDLSIRKGEVFGFVGHNGAGKSTFIHVMTGITNKSSGSFNIVNSSDNNLNQAKSKIGVMPDVSNLYENMKGIQFLSYMGHLVNDKRDKKEYYELLREVGLEGAVYKKIKSYSFGMKKKICIAQALLGNPELIILDEPTSGIDPESAIKIRELIKKLKKQGKTVFLTSHNLNEIDKVSDRVGILSEGIIKKVGTPEELKQKDANTVEILIRTKPQILKEDIIRLIEKHKFPISFLKNNGNYTYLVAKSEDVIPHLTEKLINDGVLIYELKLNEQSLEDVFMTV